MIVGLTGGIGSGKTTVCQYFEQLGIAIVDADTIAHDITRIGSPALKTITSHFGKHILLANGELNRAALREIVFNDAGEKHVLETIIHPAIRTEISNQLELASKRDASYCILASPLLIETKQLQLVDKVIVVDLPEESQLKRAATRDAQNSSQIKKIMRAQIDRTKRLSFADYIIDNSVDLQYTQNQVKVIHSQLIELIK